jgi:hypothetical protein
LFQQLRKIQDNTEEKFRETVELKIFSKSIQQLSDKLRTVNEIVDSKANKDETRKAFAFIEEKIREIVTLIADMQNSRRRTAGRKMPVQCISCDENFYEYNHERADTAELPVTKTPVAHHLNSFSVRVKSRK